MVSRAIPLPDTRAHSMVMESWDIRSQAYKDPELAIAVKDSLSVRSCAYRRPHWPRVCGRCHFYKKLLFSRVILEVHWSVNSTTYGCRSDL